MFMTKKDYDAVMAQKPTDIFPRMPLKDLLDRARAGVGLVAVSGSHRAEGHKRLKYGSVLIVSLLFASEYRSLDSKLFAKFE